MNITWNGTKLKHTPNPKYLGVTVDRTLTWRSLWLQPTEIVCAESPTEADITFARSINPHLFYSRLLLPCLITIEWLQESDGRPETCVNVAGCLDRGEWLNCTHLRALVPTNGKMSLDPEETLEATRRWMAPPVRAEHNDHETEVPVKLPKDPQSSRERRCLPDQQMKIPECSKRTCIPKWRDFHFAGTFHGKRGTA